MSGCRVIPLGERAESLVVQIDPKRTHTCDPSLIARVDARWQEMRTANPRLFDGRILAFQSFEARPTVVFAREASYRHMAVQPQIPTGVTQLGVTGILTCGAGDEKRALLGRRSSQTLLYPGRWELAPSGGVDAPPIGVNQMRLDDLRRQLANEVREELGIAIDPQRLRARALCHDPVAPSIDVVFELDIEDRELPIRLDWEYDDLLWLPLCELPRHLATLDVIEPSVALLQGI